MNNVDPYMLTNAGAPIYWQVDILWAMLATGEQTSGSYSLMEELCPKGSGPTPHWHDQDEMFYMLDGQVTFLAGDKTFQAGAGAFVFVPRGTVHSFRVDSDTCRLLNCYTPAGFERIIEEAGQPAEKRELPPKGLPAHMDQASMMALFERVGMHIAAMPDVLREQS